MSITKLHGRIVSATISDTWMVKLGQKVISSGCTPELAKADKMGIVINIYEPYTQGLTTDIFQVWWEGARCPFYMKSKDLEFGKEAN